MPAAARELDWKKINMSKKNEELSKSARTEKYRDEIYSLQILLIRTQAGPGRTVKQELE